MCENKTVYDRNKLTDEIVKKHFISPVIDIEHWDDVRDMDCFNYSHNLSPITGPIVPRKLDFTAHDDEDMSGGLSPAASMSPPYRRVRALRLFDSPLTPKTILQKCSTPSQTQSRSRLFPPKVPPPSGLPPSSSHHLHPPSDAEDSALGSLPPDAPLDDSGQPSEHPCAVLAPGAATAALSSVAINPFTPNGQLLNKKKRALSKTPTLWGDTTPEQPAKRLRESNISRYNVEFVELGVVGSGQFGRVARCANKLDGCVYAIKRSLRPVAGSAAERAALNEVYAHAVLGKHPHVVRYYSAWAEDDHMVIQNEYCDGGSLQDLVGAGPLRERELLVLLRHIASGLHYIHSKRLVHMDVKPGNIFISETEASPPSTPSRDPDRANDRIDDDRDRDDDVYDDDRSDADDDVGDDADSAVDSDSGGGRRRSRRFKIGDLGHVTCLSAPTVEEGDCRYLPREVLQEDFSHLTKADIFAFGLTLFEAAGGGPLPKNGPQWHDYRDGKLPYLSSLSKEFNNLLKSMVDPDPKSRPSASELRRHPLILKPANAEEGLRRQLAQARAENEVLVRKLREAAKFIKSLPASLMKAGHDQSRIRTRSCKRQPLKKILASQEIVAEMLKGVNLPTLTDRQRNKLKSKSTSDNFK